MQPPGSLPGMRNLAIMPASPPMMIQAIQPCSSRYPINSSSFGPRIDGRGLRRTYPTPTPCAGASATVGRKGYYFGGNIGDWSLIAAGGLFG